MNGDAALLLLADSRLPAGGHAHSGGVEEAVRRGAVTGAGDLARFLRGRLATAGLVTAALAAAACELAAAHDPGAPPPGDTADTVSLWRRLDAEADARTASPAQREAARLQGRLLLRTARRMWPSAALDTLARAVPEGPHHPVALGAAAASAGCAPRQAALAAAYTSVTGPATAAVRLLGLDPVTVHRLLADLATALDDTARAACASLDDAIPEDDEPEECGHQGHQTRLHQGHQPERHPAGHAPAHAAGHVAEHAAGHPVEHAAWQARWHALPGHSAPALDLLAEGHLTNPMKLFVS
ncbi:urease accessory protein UreF [Microbispora bryophytorum]|uniref:Urease accessory protein UreF n=1 Tax=Microbispora bryophytorum subsp. camponoti TaxID=1677852 RepID=A0ABR8L7B6_9ACTN|nr:urease accessory UreF family protein [Microbispora camponoti]MBD3144399.1 urease accessory protein UreF [Microbispora camponoti]